MTDMTDVERDVKGEARAAKGSLRDVDPIVFGSATAVIGAFVVWGVAAPENLNEVLGGILAGSSPPSAGSISPWRSRSWQCACS